MTVDEVLDIALRHHQAGNLTEALTAYGIVLEVDPENFDALHLKGVALLQSDESQAAVPLIQQALRVRPDNSDAYNNLSAALVECGEYQAAIDAANQALQLDPSQVDAHYHTARSHQALGNVDDAKQSLTQLLTAVPDHAAARDLYTELSRTPAHAVPNPHFEQSSAPAPEFSVTALLSNVPLVEPPQPAPKYQIIAPAPVRPVRIVSLTRGKAEDTALWQCLKQHGHERYHILEHNTRGLPEVYNEFINQYQGTDEILVLVHDDVSILDVFFEAKLTAAMKHFSVIGMAGSAEFVDSGQRFLNWYFNSPNQRFSGGVYHNDPDGSGKWSNYGPAPKPCLMVDGLLIALDMRKIGNVRFDTRYKFHFYDLDFGLTAIRAGLNVGTWPIAVVHDSKGNTTSTAFDQAREIFRDKWRAIMNPIALALPE